LLTLLCLYHDVQLGGTIPANFSKVRHGSYVWVLVCIAMVVAVRLVCVRDECMVLTESGPASCCRPPVAHLLPAFASTHPSPACFSNKLRDVTAFELHRCNFTGPLPGMDYRR
jgi:hypothetical protein